MIYSFSITLRLQFHAHLEYELVTLPRIASSNVFPGLEDCSSDQNTLLQGDIKPAHGFVKVNFKIVTLVSSKRDHHLNLIMISDYQKGVPETPMFLLLFLLKIGAFYLI